MSEKIKHRNIFLVGLMGAGKTTVGRVLARRMQLEFFDSDREIESRTGVNVPTIFEIEGEDGFRDREARVIETLADSSGSVIATGGGAVLRPENRANMKRGGFVVYLDVPTHLLWERVKHDKNRPLLQVDNPLGKLRELYTQRDPLYREVADFVVDGGRHNANGVLNVLFKEISERWKP